MISRLLCRNFGFQNSNHIDEVWSWYFLLPFFKMKLFWLRVSINSLKSRVGIPISSATSYSSFPKFHTKWAKSEIMGLSQNSIKTIKNKQRYLIPLKWIWMFVFVVMIYLDEQRIVWSKLGGEIETFLNVQY